MNWNERTGHGTRPRMNYTINHGYRIRNGHRDRGLGVFLGLEFLRFGIGNRHWMESWNLGERYLGYHTSSSWIENPCMSS